MLNFSASFLLPSSMSYSEDQSFRNREASQVGSVSCLLNLKNSCPLEIQPSDKCHFQKYNLALIF